MKLNAHTRLLAGPNIAPVGSYKGENESDLKGRQSFRETRENDSIPKETSAAERLLADDTVDGYIPSSEVFEGPDDGNPDPMAVQSDADAETLFNTVQTQPMGPAA
jgi:hypothetical protein